MKIKFVALALAFVLGAHNEAAAAETDGFHIGRVVGYEKTDAGIRVELASGFSATLPAGSEIPEEFRAKTPIGLAPTSINNAVALVEDAKIGEMRWKRARICAPLSTLLLTESGFALIMDPTPFYFRMDSKVEFYKENAVRVSEAWAKHDKIDVVYDEAPGQDGAAILRVQRAACQD